MKKMFHFVLLLSAWTLAGINGCSSDAVSENPTSSDPCTDACTLDDKKCDDNNVYVCEKSSDADDACNTWTLKETCPDGKHCDTTSFVCLEGCTETCDDENTKRCSTNGLEKCTPDENGCASWSIVDPCEEQTCDPETLTCVNKESDENDNGENDNGENDNGENDNGENDNGEEAGCPNACDPATDTKKCDGEDLYACLKNEDAEVECYTWTLDKTCDAGQHCDETSLSCIAGCTEICEETQNMRCSVDGLEQCTPDENGCASWSVIDPCDGGSCDSNTLKCMKSCNNQCSEGQKKCDNNGIAKCTKDANECLVWGEPAACGEGKTCDPSTTQCETICNSNCTEKGKKENHATSQKVCTDVNGKGCLQWVETKCAKGQKFDTKQNKCVSVCGSDCEPFTIVFVPDSQEYTRRIEKVDGKIVKKKEDSKGNVTSSGTRPINIFPDQLQWIQDNKDTYNIKAVIHLGDMTDTNTDIAWELNNYAYTTYLDGLNLPYTVAPGNHDFKQCTSNSAAVDIEKKECVGSNGSTYLRSNTKISKIGKFNQSRAKVKDRAWFKEYAADKDAKVGNSFITFKAANIDFLVIALEYAPRKSVITWANKVIDNHPNHKVIIATHSYLSPSSKDKTTCASVPTKNSSGQFTSHYSGVSDDAKKGFKEDAYGGKNIFDDLVAKHNNIILIANGHVAGSCFRLNKGNHGNTVAEMAVDYQTEDGIYSKCGHTHAHGGAGTGWFRMLKFDPQNYTITASTTSSLGAKRFGSKQVKGENANGKKWFYCKDLYPQDPKAKPSYKIDIDSDAHRFTNHHAFVANFDFVTPVDYDGK